MRTIHVIDKLILREGQLKCKKDRRWQKAHYKQGDLDGACGAYSISMCLNILGVFEADELYSDTDFDKRSAEWRMIKALHGFGLYRDGMKTEDIKEIIQSNYSKYVSCDSRNYKERDFMDFIKESLDDNDPVIIEIDYNSKDGHWIVGVGYECDKKGNMLSVLTLDPGTDSPTYSYWNGVLSLQKIPRKRFGYEYSSIGTDNVSITDAIVIKRKTGKQ